jgi:hypothetical protein
MQVRGPDYSPSDAELIWALGSLMERAHHVGAHGPHCYLFPLHIAADRYNPLEPMTVWGLKMPWAAVKEAAGIPRLRPTAFAIRL